MQKSFRAATIRANSFNDETNTIDIVWTTGAAVRRADPYTGDEFDEVLSLEPGDVDLTRLNAGAPLLDTHQSDEIANVVGVIVAGSAKIEGGRGIATVLLSRAASVSDITLKIIEGVARNISVGYLIAHSIVRQDGDPPTVLVDSWTPIELSIVPIPADPGAQIRKHGSDPKPLSRRERRFRNGAAYAARLLQPTQTSDEARGAAEARKALGSIGQISKVEGVKKIDKRAVERGAREARNLLGCGR